MFSVLININFAQATSTINVTATSIATGSTGLAAVEPGTSMYLNPSTLNHLKGRYFLSSLGSDYWSVSLSENSLDTTLPAGISYVEKKISSGSSTTAPTVFKDFRFSVADFATQKLSVGITAHQVHIIDGDNAYKNTNADFGMIYTPKSYLGIALAFYDRMSVDPSIPDKFKPTPKTALGINYLYRKFLRVRADILSQDFDHLEKPILMTGFESFLTHWTVVRLGYKSDLSSKTEYFTAGAGFIGPRFNLQYGFEKQSDSDENTMHTVDLGLPF